MQREHRNATELARNHSATEFARNHSGSVEFKAPSHRAVGNLSGPRKGLKRPREAGIRAKPQREHRNATEFACETTAGASKRNGIRAKPQRERRNQGPVPPPRVPLRSATNSFTLNVRTPLCKHCLGNKCTLCEHSITCMCCRHTTVKRIS